jgi:1-acyl-sn-glycerol-3-phosphate acyltransferase
VKEPVYPVVIRLAKALQMGMGWKVTVRGAENLPATGPVVLAINHSGYLDFVFAAWACVFERKRWVRFLAKKEIFGHKIAGPLMRGMRHIPVDRRKDPAKALDLAIDALRRGEVIGTFPEATINRSFVPRKGKTGTVRMAQASGAPVIPLAVWGAHRILTKGRPRNFQRRVAISVIIGPPLLFDASEDARAGTERLMQAIRRLVDEAQHSYPQQPAGDHDRWWLPAHMGGTAPTPEEVAAEVALTDRKRAADGSPESNGEPASEPAANFDALEEVPAADATGEPAASEVPD